MDVFKSIKTYFKAFGIYPSSCSQNYSNSIKSWLILLVFVMSSASICAFFFCEAQLFEEYADACNTFITMCGNVVNLMTYISRGKFFFVFMTDFDSFVQKSM